MVNLCGIGALSMMTKCWSLLTPRSNLYPLPFARHGEGICGPYAVSYTPPQASPDRRAKSQVNLGGHGIDGSPNVTQHPYRSRLRLLLPIIILCWIGAERSSNRLLQ